jgi:predicted PurR-regulated permease PerM
LATVTAAIVVGLIVASTFAPYVHRLRYDRGWDRTKAAAAVSAVALLVIVLAIALLVLSFAPYISDLLADIQAGLASTDDLLLRYGVPPPVVSVMELAFGDVQTWLRGLLADVVAPIASLVTVLILGGFLTFFLLQDGDRAWDKLVSGMDPWRREALTARGRIALERVGGYLRGTSIMAAIDAVADFVFLTILGVPLAAPLAVLVFMGGFVPYVGGFLTTTILFVVTIGAVGLTPALILLVLIGITNVIQGQILAPKVYGRTVEIHPALVLIALPAGYALFGVLGIFGALPVVAFVTAISPAVVEALDTEPGQSTTRGLVPTWLDRLGQWSWRGLVVMALLFVAVGLMVAMPTVVVPIVLATILAATLEPIAARLRARGMSRGRAALTTTLLTAAVVVAIVAVTAASLIGPLSEAVSTAVEGAAASGAAPSLVEVVRAFADGIETNVTSILGDFAGLFVVLGLSTLLTFYFMRDGPRLWELFLERIHGPRRARIAVAGPRAAGILNGYMVGTTVISAFGAFCQWLVMVILGLPFAIPITILSFFGGYIPYIGSMITTLLGFLVAVAVGDTRDIVIMFIFTIVLNIVQGNFVAPLVYGRTVSLHPAVVLLAIPAGSAVAGILGMFLVVPFLGVVASTWRTVLHVFDPDEEIARQAAMEVAAAAAPVEGAAPAT